MPTTDEVREAQRQNWNRAAAAWKKWEASRNAMERPVGEALLRCLELRGDERLLDVATGTGDQGLEGARRLPDGSVVAVDLSDEMVKLASENAREQGLTNFEARTADAGDLPFPDASFDAVVCRFGVMLFPDPELALREMVRVLVPGGRIAIATWGPPDQNPWMTTVMGAVNRVLTPPPPVPGAPSCFRHAPPGNLVALLGRAGIPDPVEEAVALEHAYESPETYWQMIGEVAGGLANALKNAPADRRAAAEQSVLEALREQAGGGPLIARGSAWVVSGRKPASAA